MPADSRRRGQRGSSLPLIIAFAAIVLMLVVVVVDASSAYLRRQELDALADGAALHGADLSAEGHDVYQGGLGNADLDLSAKEAQAAVRRYLREVGAQRDHPGLSAAVRIVGDRVLVTLSAPIDLPLHLPGAPVRPIVTATASAVVRPDAD